MNRLQYIDVLRGYAILAVILVHTSQVVQGITPEFMEILAKGAHGVQLFFIASAYTMFYSLEARKNETNNAIYFYIRRFFRIAPLFYIAMIYYSVAGSSWNTSFPELNNVLVTSLFLNGWSPYWINTLVPGCWSIAVEMSFYLIVPFLFTYVNSLKRAVILSAIFIVISMYINEFMFFNPLINNIDIWRGYLNLWIINQLPVFSLGIILYYCMKNGDTVSLFKKVIFIVFYALFCKKNDQNIIHYYGLILLIFSYGVINLPLRINVALSYIGKISYSAYITHFSILTILKDFILFSSSPTINFIMLYTVGTILTVIVSRLAYVWIEKPMIRYGNSLIDGKQRPCVNLN